MSEAVGFEPWGYSYGFGNGSHFIHGDWRDISMHHVHKIGRYYEPNVEYGVTDPRLVCPVTQLCLQVLRRFLAWHKSDPDGFVRRIIAGVATVNASLDEAHERYLQTKN
jgi:hypothetical protein